MISKSVIRRVAEQKGVTYDEAEVFLQKREAHQKQPKVPPFPPAAQATARKLSGIIDAGGVMAPIAYGALTRLCVMWCADGDNLKVAATHDVEKDVIDLTGNSVIVLELINMTIQLFPDVEELKL